LQPSFSCSSRLSKLHDTPLHDVQAQQPPPPPAAGGENDLYSYRRGDIPIFNFDEADRILIATLQELIEVRLSIFSLCTVKKGQRHLR
jgi:hypothetical protein